MMRIFKHVPIKVILIGLLLIGLRFWPAIYAGKELVFGDNYSLQVPGRIYTGYWLKQGIIPWWNPMIFAGIPWAHEISQSVFYPSTLLFTFLDPGIALNLTIAIHLLFTYFGMFLLLRILVKNDNASLIGAILWAFSTQVTGSSNNLVTVQSIAWFPWISYWGVRLFDKKYTHLLYAIFVLGQFLGGYPQHVVYGIALSVFLNAAYHWKRISLKLWFISWLKTGILTLGVTAVAWLPFLEIFTNSTRMDQTTMQAATGSLHPLMLIKAIIPYFFDNPAAGFKWGPAWSGFPNSLFYLTWMGLIGVVIALKNDFSKFKVLLLFVILSVIFSMGNRLPGFHFVQDVLPFFKFGRYPSMILMCTNLVLIIISAYGLNSLSFIKNTPKNHLERWFCRIKHNYLY